MYRVILASESPRRKEIMEQMGIPFQAMGSSLAEVVEEKEPAAMVQALAAIKAKDIASKIAEAKDTAADMIIIGADTMVFFQENVLGKPKDRVDAVRMLQMLSGGEHEVYTGVNIIIRPVQGHMESISFAVCTKVLMRALTREQIENYVATGEPMDKAGAYAIQGRFGIYISEIHGDYYNIVGFPIAKIHEKLLEHGIDLLDLK
ncbi:MAG TPA: septum formation protein Maf [Lachnospiraceae bacterium]|jgi:septum formation protein|nr:septum formation protein Maf [Lachnospiraceae bacterium]HCA69804.1 septum formation protein Maf [Lachnospiraceae bacterium]HCM13919.1 septum formation protein Maf [Lachnospiraceae bacterium]HCR40059.1 septum formation protein Maf [Lachnospiraceae bacterium]